MKQKFDIKEIKRGISDGILQGRFKTPNSMINRLCKNVIDYKEIKMEPRLYSLYYSELSENEKDRIENCFEEENIKEVLTVEEEEIHKKNIIDKLDEKTKKELINHIGISNFFVYSYSNIEYQLQNVLDKFKIKKTKKIWTPGEVNVLLESDKAYKLSKEETEEQFKDRIKRFINKRVFIETYYGILQGKIKIRDNDICFFDVKTRKRYNYLKVTNGYAVIIPKVIACID